MHACFEVIQSDPWACSPTRDIKVQKLTPEQIEQILNMTEPGELELGMRKRLNEAMRRRFESGEGLPPHSPVLIPKDPEARSVPGLKPGLLEKWKATKDPKDKCMP